MDQEKNIQNEKVSGEEAGGLTVKSPTGQTVTGKKRLEVEPVVTVVNVRSQDNINLLRVTRQWIRSHLQFRSFP